MPNETEKILIQNIERSEIDFSSGGEVSTFEHCDIGS